MEKKDKVVRLEDYENLRKYTTDEVDNTSPPLPFAKKPATNTSGPSKAIRIAAQHHEDIKILNERMKRVENMIKHLMDEDKDTREELVYLRRFTDKLFRILKDLHKSLESK